MTTTTNASLTDRYVAAALKGVQADQREDVAAELRGSIADAVEVRTSQGESPDTAERAVLLELGGPTRLAAGYSGRPLYLIGPAFYPDYIRLLRLLLLLQLLNRQSSHDSPEGSAFFHSAVLCDGALPVQLS